MDEKYRKVGTPEDRIIEECGEIIQAVIKGKRFGWDNHHPDRPNITNIEQLAIEIGDIITAYKDFLNKRVIEKNG